MINLRIIRLHGPTCLRAHKLRKGCRRSICRNPERNGPCHPLRGIWRAADKNTVAKTRAKFGECQKVVGFIIQINLIDDDGDSVDVNSSQLILNRNTLPIYFLLPQLKSPSLSKTLRSFSDLVAQNSKPIAISPDPCWVFSFSSLSYQFPVKVEIFTSFFSYYYFFLFLI